VDRDVDELAARRDRPQTGGASDATDNRARNLVERAMNSASQLFAGRTDGEAVPTPARKHARQQSATDSRRTQGTSTAVSRETDANGASAALPAADLLAASPVSRETAPATSGATPIAEAAAAAVQVRSRSMRGSLPAPPTTRLITVANQKGGVGKTTTAVNVAAALALAGLHVLVLDLDPQGNASTALGVDHHADVPSVYDVLVEGRPLGEVIAPVDGFDTLLCAPATIDLAGAEIELVSLVARESRLQRALSMYQRHRSQAGAPRLDYVFIDCPPSLGLLTVNALVAVTEVLIPIQCEYYALEGLGQLLRNVELIKSHLNPDLHVSTILLTMYDARTRLAAQVADEVRAHFPALVLATTVPRSVRVSEAPSYGQTVMTYDPGSTGALSYLEAAREIAGRAVAHQSEESP
jgi:chromosome partitioning protein